MSTPDLNRFAEVVASLIDATNSNGIEWAKLNPTTYSWTSANGRVVLQQVTSTIRVAGSAREVKRYLLQVFDANNEAQLVINSGSMTEAHDILRKLFLAVGETMTSKGIDFLSSMINKRS